MNLQLPDRVIIQDINQLQAAYYTAQMQAYGTKVVAGISAGKKGKKINSIPIFDLVEEAIAKVGKIDATLIFSSPYEVLDAAREAISAQIKYVIIVTQGVPPLDMVRLKQEAKGTDTIILGAGSHGIILPEKICLGTFQHQFYQSGNIGLISYSEYLAYEVALVLNSAGIGQSIVVHLGNEEFFGSSYQQWLSILSQDQNTEAIILIGKPDYHQEQAAAYYRDSGISKPVISYLAGLYAPQERHFLDATTIIANQLSYSVPSANTEKQIMTALKKAGIAIAKRPQEVSQLLQKMLMTK